MTDITRRLITAAGFGLMGTARAQEAPKVELPRIAAATEPDQPTPNADPVSRRLGVAVVGLGHLALDQILPGFGSSKHMKVTALVSGDAGKARIVAGQYGVAETHLYDYAGFDRLRDNPDVDVIYIVLPNDMHAEYTVRAAEAGKHVLCEKPMATSVADADRMVTACREAGRRLMIAYRMQYNPYHRALIGMAREQTYGPVRMIVAENGQNQATAPAQWRHSLKQAGGGSLPDVGLYCLSAARYITGEEPVEIQASLTRPANDPRFREVEDLCMFTLRFPSGIVAQCASGYSHHESRSLRVLAADAAINMDPAFAYEGLEMRISRKEGGATAVEQRRFPDHNQFAREMDHFAEAIRGGLQPHTPGEEGAQDMRLIAAIYAAAQGGGTLKLPPVPGHDTTRGPPPTQT